MTRIDTAAVPAALDPEPETVATVVANRDLLGRTVRGTAITLGGQWARFVVQLGSTIVLARILTPDDYGLIGMVVAITGFAELFVGMGLSTATIQRREVTSDQLSTLFWVNTAAGAIVALITGSMAPVVAGFYGRPELVGVMRALSTTFLLSGLSVQHHALMNRRMAFGRLTAIDVTSMVGSVAAAIACAVAGLGYWSLVVLNVAAPAVRLVLSWIAEPWRPGRPVRSSGVLPMLTFGANLSLFTLLNYLSRNLDNILLGRVWGAAQLGLYTRAYQLLMLPIHQVSVPLARVAIPTLSRLQDDDDRYGRYYANAVACIGYTVVPAIVVLAVLANEVILLVLGPQWTAAAPLFRILAFASIAQTVAHANGWLYTSTGHTGRQALWALFSRPILIGSFVIGVSWGAEGVAIAYAAVGAALLLPSFKFAVKGTPLTFGDVLKSFRRPALMSLVIYPVSSTVHALFASDGIIISMAVTIAAAVLAYTAVLAVSKGIRGEVVTVARAIFTGLMHSRIRARDLSA